MSEDTSLLFKKTMFDKLEESLILDFGADKAAVIFSNASLILHQELETINDRGRKAVRKHLSENILPGYACFKALQDEGLDSKSAIDYVDKILTIKAKRVGLTMGKVGKLPFAYTLFRSVIKPIMKKNYPSEGWTIRWLENSKNKVAFEMKSCLYLEELTARNAAELCTVYCQSDHIAYDPMAPGVVFKRTGTLAMGCQVCDFSFEA